MNNLYSKNTVIGGVTALFTIAGLKGLDPDPEALKLAGGVHINESINYNLGRWVITSSSIAPQVHTFSIGVSFGF